MVVASVAVVMVLMWHWGSELLLAASGLLVLAVGGSEMIIRAYMVAGHARSVMDEQQQQLWQLWQQQQPMVNECEEREPDTSVFAREKSLLGEMVSRDAWEVSEPVMYFDLQSCTR